MTLADVDRAVEAARGYASRWSVAQWRAYVWMLNEQLSGRMTYIRVA